MARAESGQSLTDKIEDRFQFRSWDTEDGLPHITVRGIAQTLDGYLWIATLDGLARFDGRRFQVICGTLAESNT